MTWLLAVLALPCVYWTLPVQTAPDVRAAGLEHVCVPVDAAEAWRGSGLAVTPVSDEELSGREVLPVPGLLVQPGLASPTRSPWVTTNGERFIRSPDVGYVSSPPAGRAALAASEAVAYGVDVFLRIDPADLAAVGRLVSWLEQVPPLSLPPVSDMAVVDDGSAETGELMNMLVRRNLLFERLTRPVSRGRHPLTVQLGTAGYRREEAADPTELALKIRRQLTDGRRSLRIYGSEVVIGRLLSDGRRARLHLLNYGGRTIEGLRVRLRGDYTITAAWASGSGRVDPTDRVVAHGATEFSVPALETYAVIDFDRSHQR